MADSNAGRVNGLTLYGWRAVGIGAQGRASFSRSHLPALIRRVDGRPGLASAGGTWSRGPQRSPSARPSRAEMRRSLNENQLVGAQINNAD
jgi:hypothetical protein